MMSSSTKKMSSTSASAITPIHQLSSLKVVKGASSDENVAPPTRKHKQCQQQQPPPAILSSGSNCGRPDLPPAAAFCDVPKKPLRPLTAYHIFFQLEREYIIQTTAGEDADKSIHDGKIRMPIGTVPRRYSEIKLLPDWHAGPGKRRKRKHRRQHGKIGFLELSQAISTRWAELEGVDPETKAFVRTIAKHELEEYYRERKAYEEAMKKEDGTTTKSANSAPKKRRVAAAPVPRKKRRATKKRPAGGEIGRSPTLQHPWQRPAASPPYDALLPETASSSAADFAPYPSSVREFGAFDDLTMTPHSILRLRRIQLQQDIDDFLSRVVDRGARHLLPRSAFGVERDRDVPNVTDDAEDNEAQENRNAFQRRNGAPRSPRAFDSSSGNFAERPVGQQRGVDEVKCTSPSAVEVDICDDEILQLWKSHN